MPFDWRKLLGIRRPASAANAQSPDESKSAHQPSVRRGYQPNESVGGEYRVLDVFEGGMGSVYLVEHHELNSPIILKTLRQANDENAVQAFRREAETWVNIGFHPNVVRAHFFRIIDGLPFVGAEYIKPNANGHNSVLDYVGAGLDETVLLRWSAQFCYGMMHACSHGVVAHRDVKPANLLVDVSGTLKVADFGLARTMALPSGARESGRERRLIAGTLPYMAPEQLLTPEQLDHRVDIYAFGVILYQLASGRFPYDTRSQESIIQSILHEQPQPLKGPLWPICESCLSKHRNNRFPTFEALLSAVSDLAKQRGVAIPPQSTGISEESDALFARLLSYRELGKSDLATQYLHEFVSKFASDYRGWTELGVIYLGQGDAQRAYDATTKSLSLYPFNSHAWNNLGVTLSRLGKFSEAVDALKTAVSHDPLNTGAMLNQCTPLVELRRPIEAVQVLERAASLAPDKASIWANLGAIKMDLGELNDAERCFEKALTLHPGLREVEANLEILRQREKTKLDAPDPAVLLAKGKVEQARQLLLERVERNPNDVDACHNLGIAALHVGNNEQAIEWFQRVVNLNPNEEFAITQLVKLHAGGGEFDTAMSYCDKLACIPGKVVQEAAFRAQILQACGRTEEAISRLKALVERDPNLDTIWFMLSEIYEREGRLKDSLRAAKRCLEVLLRVGGNRDNIDNVKQRVFVLQRAVE